MGSVLGMVGHEAFDTHAYAASKGAVIALSRAMAVRYAAERVRVNVLCPGLIRTPMSRRAQDDPSVRAMLSELQPLTGDFGEPGDVADAALYLLADESRFVTGTVLPVDGGWTAR
jgi:NAD(P)-dependent dehydrogenase (short-subunit alcohol dehydrogenase family)